MTRYYASVISYLADHEDFEDDIRLCSSEQAAKNFICNILTDYSTGGFFYDTPDEGRELCMKIQSLTIDEGCFGQNYVFSKDEQTTICSFWKEEYNHSSYSEENQWEANLSREQRMGESCADKEEID